jgi:cytidylate kinase
MSGPDRAAHADALVVAIDGAAGSGKSTLGRGLAAALGLPYVNTGLMYRALTRAALDAGVDLDDGEALAELTRRLRVRVSVGDRPELEVEGYPASLLHTAEVDAAVSRASRHPAVRSVMHEVQRALGRDGAVIEGRDIGTVVCPDAPVKFFLRADVEQRWTRRSQDRGDDVDEVARALEARDSRDATVSPLEPADDAVTIDTTDLTPEETLARALEIVRARR